MKSEALRTELDALKKEYVDVSAERERLVVRMKDVDARLNELHMPRGFRREERGLIPQKVDEIQRAVREEKDALLPRVRVTGYYTGELVVDRITPKRIYLRKPGEDHEIIFDRNGRHYSGTIDADDLARILRGKG